MGKIIAVVNQKGGVGKTTTCVNTAAALTQAGKKVLLCDFDPQGNSTSGFGVDKNTSPNMYEVIIGQTQAQRAVIHTKYGDVLPSNKALSGAEIELISEERREYKLKDALEPLREAYDFILIDSPPTLTLLTLQCLCAADSALIPVQCEYYALEGLSDLMYTVRKVRRALNTNLEIEGLLLTMYDARLNLSLQVAEEVKRHFPDKLYQTVIPRNVRLSEAPSHGMPVQYYDKFSRGADCYNTLSAEIIKRNQVIA
ncbi:MAG: AAA family ATPase [Oscillospiraceae bacterium]|nr:AAA family ATPase [Oscillospiraceae bacterium]